MNLYEPQSKLVTNLASKLSKGINPIVGQLPTGGGKTVIFSSIAQRYTAKNNKSVLIAVHRKELLTQTRKTAYNGFGLTCEPITAGSKHIPKADIYVCMVESVMRRLSKLHDIGLLIIDECHIASFNKLIPAAQKQFGEGLLVIGFTATPQTASKKRPLNLYYNDIVCGPQIQELINSGLLCQNITYAPKNVVNRLELAMKGNDFDDFLMGQKFAQSKYINNTLKEYENRCKGQKTIIFNVNVLHSIEVTKRFCDAGYNCRHLDANTPAAERSVIIDWFKHTEDAILCNVGIATVGFDEPSIKCVIVNKATASMPLWLQMCGRGGRVYAGKEFFTILDMGGNAITHGDWSDDRNWHYIFTNPPKPSKRSHAATVKSCPNCDAIIPTGAKYCKYCNYVYKPGTQGIEIELGEFIVVTKGIDVKKMVDNAQHYKQYYVFFQIGRTLAAQAKKTVPVMTTDYFTFILQRYIVLAKEWATLHGKKKLTAWHKEHAAKYLSEQLKKVYPDWQMPEILNN